MSWLKPIFEKLQVNAFIGAVSITAFICWLFTKNLLCLALCGCCAIYLFILLIIWCSNNYAHNKSLEELEEKEKKEKELESKKLEFSINLWYSTLHPNVKNNLIKLLDWETVNNYPNIKMQGENNEPLYFNYHEFILKRGYLEEPIILLMEYNNPTPCSSRTYLIHPILYDIILNHKNQQ